MWARDFALLGRTLNSSIPKPCPKLATDAVLRGMLAILDVLILRGCLMSRSKPIEYGEASPEVRAVFDDIKARRKIEDVNNFWKYLASDPALLKRTWETQKQVLAPGSLDLLTKELIYLAVSVTNGCSYGIACHTALARKAGMT